jgi:hypothetical protein
MARTFQDPGFLVWEVYPSGSRFGFSEQPNIIFHCLTDPRLRSRFVQFDGDAADAEKAVLDATNDYLIRTLDRAVPLS